jgi:hypothetical protein
MYSIIFLSPAFLKHFNSTILAIINMTQATNDPLTRFPALLSMIAALLSLIYGCMYNIRFETMRKGYKAIEWAEVDLIHC